MIIEFSLHVLGIVHHRVFVPLMLLLYDLEEHLVDIHNYLTKGLWLLWGSLKVK